jgi:hypothetical protein
VSREGLAGYFPLNHNGQWDRQAFRPFKQRPSFSLADPEVKLLDLDGDGVTDVLRNGSRFEYFYHDPEQGFVATQQVNKAQLGAFPSVSFGPATSTIWPACDLGGRFLSLICFTDNPSCHLVSEIAFNYSLPNTSALSVLTAINACD